MDTLDYILSNYLLSRYVENPENRVVLKALVHTLSPDELNILKKRLKRSSSKRNIGSELYYEAEKALSYINPQRNEPISTLIKQFTNKKSGKVEIARKKLRDRFYKQNLIIRRKILKAFLSSTKQDRLWAYVRLRNYWDNALYKDIKAVWNLYHEEECGKVIVNHFPIEYFRNNLKTLFSEKNIKLLCIRLLEYIRQQLDRGEDVSPSFVMTKTERSILDMFAKTHCPIKDGMATRMIFEKLIEILNNAKECNYKLVPKSLERYFDRVRYFDNYFPTTLWFSELSLILWCMKKLGLVGELITFEAWDQNVQEKLICSAKFKKIKKIDNDEFANECYVLFRDVIADCLPDDYKHLIRFPTCSINAGRDCTKTTIEQIENNPALSLLVKELGLEAVD